MALPSGVDKRKRGGTLAERSRQVTHYGVKLAFITPRYTLRHIVRRRSRQQQQQQPQLSATLQLRGGVTYRLTERVRWVRQLPTQRQHRHQLMPDNFNLWLKLANTDVCQKKKSPPSRFVQPFFRTFLHFLLPETTWMERMVILWVLTGKYEEWLRRLLSVNFIVGSPPSGMYRGIALFFYFYLKKDKNNDSLLLNYTK